MDNYTNQVLGVRFLILPDCYECNYPSRIILATPLLVVDNDSLVFAISTTGAVLSAPKSNILQDTIFLYR